MYYGWIIEVIKVNNRDYYSDVLRVNNRDYYGWII